MLITLHSFIIPFYQFLSVRFCRILNDFLGVCWCRISALTSRRLNAADSDIHTIYRSKFFQVRSVRQSSVFLKVPEFPSLSETKVELSRVDFYYKSLGCIITKLNVTTVYYLFSVCELQLLVEIDSKPIGEWFGQTEHCSVNLQATTWSQYFTEKSTFGGTIDNTCDGRRSTDELDYTVYYTERPPMYRKKGTNFLLRASFLILDRNW